MRYYSVTNSDNRDWLGRTFVPEAVLTEENDNYFFNVYPETIIAALMHPVHEEKMEKLWEVDAEPLFNFDYRMETNSIKVIKEVSLPVLTKEQRLSFAILVVYQCVTNPAFGKWALDYLSNKDRTNLTVKKVEEKLLDDQSSDKILMEHNMVGPCYSALAATEGSDYFAAAAGFKASQENVNLLQAAEICVALNQEQIAELLGS